MTASDKRFPAGTFTPDPRPAPARQSLLATAQLELKIQVRNGEQLLLAVVIPLAVLFGLTLTSLIDLPDPRIDTVTPGVFTLAVLSTAFTAQAITTGFDRRYGVLQRLAAAGLSRALLIGAKCLSVLVVVVGQLVVLGSAAMLLGWSPSSHWPLAVPVVALGIVSLIGLALVIGGTLRAEATLAVANLVWLVLLAVGGVIKPLTSGSWWGTVGGYTPVGALSEGLRAALTAGVTPEPRVWFVLAGWAAAGWIGTVRFFRWNS